MQTIRESKRGFLKSRIPPLVLASSRHPATFKIFIPIISRLAKFSKGHFLFKSRIPPAILKLSRIPPTISKLSRTVHQLKWAYPYPEKNIFIPYFASIFLLSRIPPQYFSFPTCSLVSMPHPASRQTYAGPGLNVRARQYSIINCTIGNHHLIASIGMIILCITDWL